MAITVTEAVDSGRLTEDSSGKHLERIFFIHGTDNPLVADPYGPVYGESHGVYSFRVTQRAVTTEKIKDAAQDGICRLTVQYSGARGMDRNPEYNWDTTAQTEHVVKARSQKHYPADQDGVGDLIEVHGDGDEMQVDGLDIYFPKGAYNETRFFAELTQEFRKTLLDLSGSVNAAEWRGWAKKEVLFVGAQARRVGMEQWNVSFHFLIQPTVVFDGQISLPGHLEKIKTVHGDQTVTKVGWDYIWFSYRKGLNAAKDRLDPKVESVHVASVYPERDFTALGLGEETLVSDLGFQSVY